ncbi:NlpC/P60 family protein [Salinispora tropica]|uniref:NLP/P60 protein n=1 Tax=Salinispora tropica (strain ATCC BAA-916 / DSM 44818 / JCM 13857 / NBRC 105044 / CNB-440) TaxID=369723 RepID=A4X0Z0_SALTO|nr:C40 family peptidase [Salinispora tropica]ABP52540.1 NLP/P60 protein [Salinispora tropica CNB-440]
MATTSPHRQASARSRRPGGLRRAAHGLLAAVAAVAVGLGVLAVPAYAEPSVDEIEAAIDKQWREMEPTIAQYNKVRAQLKENRKKSDELAKKIAPLQLESEIATKRIGGLASEYYISGPSRELGALLVSDDPNEISEELALLNRVAAMERKQLEEVLAIRKEYDDQKETLDELIAAQDKQESELAARKKQIDAEIKRLKASLPKTTVSTPQCPTVNGVVSAAARTAIRTACAQVGDPYVFGSSGPNSFDCSGLTQYAYKAAGVYLTHYTGAQWNEGKAISRSEARPGDLVFFSSPSNLHHVGLYLGNDQMVHAPRTGKPVMVGSINYMPVAGFRRPG